MIGSSNKKIVFYYYKKSEKKFLIHKNNRTFNNKNNLDSIDCIMNNSVLLSLLLVGISVLSQVDAHWGWGGFPGAGGWGRPWGGYYGGNNGWARPLLYEANPYEVQDVYARTYGYRGRRDATEMTGIECIYSSRIGSMNCNK